jgi:dGTPase
MIYDRAKLMSLEDKFLAPYAVKSKDSKGREYPEKEDSSRTPFQKDRDRIIHSRAFRRLKMKTQVFVAHHGDHFRTRLTHTLEAAQVSRDIARSLGLNEDLAEAITLAHDLGHTPFGHAGEHALDEMLQPFGLSFEHNRQSRRIVEELEHVYPGFLGLNLTYEVRQGLMKHQSPWDQAEAEFHGASLEAQVVNLADEIAYNNHDVDDGWRAGLLHEDDLNELAIWREVEKIVKEKYGEISDRAVKHDRMISSMMGFMIKDLIETSAANLENADKAENELISFSPEMTTWTKELKQFLSEKFYFHPSVLKLSEKGQQIIRDLFTRYHENPTLLPEDEQAAIKAGENPEIVIKDYIAGMTDEFAEKEAISPR